MYFSVFVCLLHIFSLAIIAIPFVQKRQYNFNTPPPPPSQPGLNRTEGPPSHNASFVTGTQGPSLWTNATWLGVPWHSTSNAYQLRGTYSLPDLAATAIRRAYLLITGLGTYHATVNGQNVSPDKAAFLVQTMQYDKRILYDVFDVTSAVQREAKSLTLAVALGSWWYNTNSSYFYDPPFMLPFGERSLRSLLVIHTTDSHQPMLLLPSGSQGTWRAAPGMVVSDDMFIGEVQDGRLATPGWGNPDFDDSHWAPAPEVQPPLGANQATGRLDPLVTADPAGWSPVKMYALNDTTFVYDMGKNSAGRCSFTLPPNLPPGHTVHFLHGERVVAPGGAVIQSPATPNRHTGDPLYELTAYTARGGDSREVFSPQFVYYGFQYLQISNLPVVPHLEDLECTFLHSALARAGEVGAVDAVNGSATSVGSGLHSVADMLAIVHEATLRTAMSNYQGYPTDCPTREKRGWTGDMLAASDTIMASYDMQAAYKNWLRTVADAQSWHNGPEGCVPEIAPSFMTGTG